MLWAPIELGCVMHFKSRNIDSKRNDVNCESDRAWGSGCVGRLNLLLTHIHRRLEAHTQRSVESGINAIVWTCNYPYMYNITFVLVESLGMKGFAISSICNGVLCKNGKLIQTTQEGRGEHWYHGTLSQRSIQFFYPQLVSYVPMKIFLKCNNKIT